MSRVNNYPIQEFVEQPEPKEAKARSRADIAADFVNHESVNTDEPKQDSLDDTDNPEGVLLEDSNWERIESPRQSCE